MQDGEGMTRLALAILCLILPGCAGYTYSAGAGYPPPFIFASMKVPDQPPMTASLSMPLPPATMPKGN